MGEKQAFPSEVVGTLRDGRQLVRVLCELAAETAEVDSAEWIHIMPVGPVVQARDGRAFQVVDPQRVVMATEVPLLIDWEHRSEFGETRAAGWVEELVVEQSIGRFPQPGLWGRVRWTEEGTKDVKARAYRFLSPVLLIGSSTKDVQRVASVALTNLPALRMKSLDSFRERLSQRFGPFVGGGGAMNEETKRALCTAFGLKPEASDEQILAAAQAKRDDNAEPARLREACTLLTQDLAAQKKRAHEAEAELVSFKKQQVKAEIDAVLDQASKDGQITPADRKTYQAFCEKSPEDFVMFKESILPKFPKLAQSAPKSSAGSTKQSASGEELARRYGFKLEELAAADKYTAELRPAMNEED